MGEVAPSHLDPYYTLEMIEMTASPGSVGADEESPEWPKSP